MVGTVYTHTHKHIYICVKYQIKCLSSQPVMLLSLNSTHIHFLYLQNDESQIYFIKAFLGVSI